MKKNFAFVSFIILIVFGTSNCNKFTDQDPGNADFAIFDVSNESEWNYWIISNKDQSYLLVDVVGSELKKVFYKPNPDNEGFPIFINDRGLPEKVVINGYTFVFDNFKGNTFDIAVIDLTNRVQIFRNVESDFNFDDINKNAARLSESINLLQMAGIATSVASCGIGAILAPSGIGLGLALVGCGATAAIISSELAPKNLEILGLTGQTIGAFTTTLSCINGAGLTCVLGILSEASTITDSQISLLEENSKTITQAKTQLSNIVKKSGNFGITGGTYSINEDWRSAVKSELGNEYRPLDWVELKDYYNQGGDLLTLFDDLGLTEYRNSAAILRNGNQKYSSDRGYFASRHEHNKPSNYLAHDNIDNYLISLGSWEGSRKILAIIDK